MSVTETVKVLFIILKRVGRFCESSRKVRCSRVLVFVCTFRVPLFFVLSKVLFSRGAFHGLSFFSFLVGGIGKLMIPCLFLSVATNLCKIIISSRVGVSSVIRIIGGALAVRYGIDTG